MVSNEKLDVMLHGADRIVRDEFDKTGGIQQRGVVVLPDRMVFVPLDWHDDASKIEAIRNFKRRVWKERAKDYVIVGEAWMASWPRPGERPQRPSLSDRRKEVAYVLAANTAGYSLFGFRTIEPVFVSSPPRRRLGPLTIEVNIDGFLPGRNEYADI